MSAKTLTEQHEYKVWVDVSGFVTKKVLAGSHEEAERKVAKMVFQADEQTPKPKMLCAFEWSTPFWGCFNEDAPETPPVMSNE